MMKNLEILSIDGSDYYILKEILHNKVYYLYLMNVEDGNDMFIRKANEQNQDIVLPLDSDEEFDLACALLFKKS